MCVSMTMHHMSGFFSPPFFVSYIKNLRTGAVVYRLKGSISLHKKRPRRKKEKKKSTWKEWRSTYGSSPHRCCRSSRRRRHISTGSGCSVRCCTETARLHILTPYEFLRSDESVKGNTVKVGSNNNEEERILFETGSKGTFLEKGTKSEKRN